MQWCWYYYLTKKEKRKKKKKKSHRIIFLFSFFFFLVKKFFKILSKPWFDNRFPIWAFFSHSGSMLLFLWAKRHKIITFPCFHLSGETLLSWMCVFLILSFDSFLVIPLICLTILIPHFVCTCFGSCTNESVNFKHCKCTYVYHLSLSEFMVSPFSVSHTFFFQ